MWRQWAGSTNFADSSKYQHVYIEEDDRMREATGAIAVPPQRPAIPQESSKHKLTDLPYRTGCPICTESRGKAHHRPRQVSRNHNDTDGFCLLEDVLGQPNLVCFHRSRCPYRNSFAQQTAVVQLFGALLANVSL